MTSYASIEVTRSASVVPVASLKRKRDPLDEELGDGFGESGFIDGLEPLVDGLEDYEVEYANEPSRFGAQVLPVADLPDDFSGEPQDGFEYLFTVRRSAQTLPIFTKVPNPYHTTSDPVPGPPQEKHPIKEPHPAVPKEEWKEMFESRFAALRKGLVSMPAPRAQGVFVPNYKDRDAWWKFINGDLKPGSFQFQTTTWPTGTGHFDSSDVLHDHGDTAGIVDGEESSDDETEEHQMNEDDIHVQMVAIVNDDPPSALPDPPSKSSSSRPRSPGPAKSPSSMTLVHAKGYSPRPPSTQLLAQMNNKTAFQVLMYFGHWITTRLDSYSSWPSGQPPLCSTDARWIFFLLARLDAELSSEQISTLRILSRGCLALLLASLRASKDDEPPSVEVLDGRGSCWMVVVAVAKGWGQLDLWDDAVEAVNAVE